MIFKTLKEKCEYYRSIEDHRLLPNTPVICMVDGRSFSKQIKKVFQSPFDDDLIRMMNESAKYVCENVSGMVVAFVQSDEASFYFRDYDDEGCKEGFFDYRLCKLQSVIASMMTARFNQLYIDWQVRSGKRERISDSKIVTFDCKCWNVPNENDVYAWFLYRQNDCVRNSKQAVAQKVCSHRELNGKNTDEQIVIAKTKGLDWNAFDDGKKLGRLIYRESVSYVSQETGEEYKRNPFVIHDSFDIRNSHSEFIDIISV